MLYRFSTLANASVRNLATTARASISHDGQEEQPAAPPLKTVFPTRRAVKGMITNNQDDTRVFTDGSRLREGIGAAAVALRGNSKTPISTAQVFLPGEELSCNDAECVGLLLGLYLLRIEKSPFTTASIYGDNWSSIRSLEVGGKQSMLKRMWGQHMEACIRMLRGTHTNIQLSFAWIPGHSGIEGNMLANRLARQASKGRLNNVLVEGHARQDFVHIKDLNSFFEALGLRRSAKNRIGG